MKKFNFLMFFVKASLRHPLSSEGVGEFVINNFFTHGKENEHQESKKSRMSYERKKKKKSLCF